MTTEANGGAEKQATAIVNDAPIDRHMQVGMCPTAANAYRWMNCLDSWRLELLAKSTTQQTVSIANERGEHIHRALEHIDSAEQFAKATEDLSLDEKVSVNACEALYWKLLEDVFKDGEGLDIVKGRRIWMTVDGKNIVTAKLARMVFRASTGTLLIPDFATGSREVPHPAINPQLNASLACAVFSLVNLQYDIKEAYIAIVQPLYTVEPVRVHRIGKEDLVNLVNSVMEAGILSMEESPEPRLKAGEWCEWCAGRSICPIRQKLVAKVLSLAEKIEQIPNDKLAEMLLQIPAIKKILTALEESALERALKEPTCLPCYTLQTNEDKIKVTDLDDLVKRYEGDAEMTVKIDAIIKKNVFKAQKTTETRTISNPKMLLEQLKAAGVNDLDLLRLTSNLKKEKK